MYTRIASLALAALAGAALAAVVQERRVRQREYDTAYGVLNRSGVEARLRRLRGSVDIVYFDMDHFHELNAELGQEEVDRLMRQALCLRESDVMFIGRWKSGDELIIVVKAGQGTALARRLQERLKSFGLSATIGVTPARNYHQAILAAYETVAAAKQANSRGRVLANTAA